MALPVVIDSDSPDEEVSDTEGCVAELDVNSGSAVAKEVVSADAASEDALKLPEDTASVPLLGDVRPVVLASTPTEVLIAETGSEKVSVSKVELVCRPDIAVVLRLLVVNLLETSISDCEESIIAVRLTDASFD